MEAAQNEYQKKMAEQQQQQFFSIYTDKLRSKSKPFSFSCSPLRPKRDVHFFLSSDENKDSKALKSCRNWELDNKGRSIRNAEE